MQDEATRERVKIILVAFAYLSLMAMTGVVAGYITYKTYAASECVRSLGGGK